MGKVYEQLANEQGIFRRCEKLRICTRAGKQTKGDKTFMECPQETAGRTHQDYCGCLQLHLLSEKVYSKQELAETKVKASITAFSGAGCTKYGV